MIRIVLTAATLITLSQAVLAEGSPAVNGPTSSSLTAQIDGFHGSSGTGKSVSDRFSGDGGLGGTRRGQ